MDEYFSKSYHIIILFQKFPKYRKTKDNNKKPSSSQTNQGGFRWR